MMAVAPFWGRVSSVGLLINILLSLPIFFLTLTEPLEALVCCPGNGGMTLQKRALRCGLIITFTIAGWMLPFIVALVALFASIFCMCNDLIFPLAFVWILRTASAKRFSRIEYLQMATMVVVAGIVMLFGFKGAV